MEKQMQVEKPVEEFQEPGASKGSKEVTEEHFLKDLYLFMRKQNTAIERIPHLGFKQIDLFVMFQTVNDLGGYQQVTSQQLWKQVYNTLGGNPRSTSAATCTRRHYEKLLLPYECHVKGIVMSVVPQHPPKPFHYITYGKEDECGPRLSKRRMLSIPLHQNRLTLHSDPHMNLFPLSVQYPHHYFPPTHAVLPPYVPMLPPVMAPVPKPQVPVLSSPPERSTEALEHLRSLSEWYKTSSGLVQQPLNLSKKAAPCQLARAPVSSFSPPSTSKNPKFLNKPSTLYTSLHAGPPRSEGSDTQEGESSDEVPACSYSCEEKESDVIDVTEPRDSCSPVYAISSGTDGNVVAEVSRKPSSPRTDFTTRPRDEREAGGDLTLTRILPREKEGNLEIEMPLSVFHNWFRLYRSSTMANRMKEAPPPVGVEPTGQKNWLHADAFNTNLTFHLNPLSSAEDTRLRSEPSLTPAAQTIGNHRSTSQSHLPGHGTSPPGGSLQNAPSRDAYPFDLTETNRPFHSKPRKLWDARDKEVASSLVKYDATPARAQVDFVNKWCAHDGSRRPDAGSAAAAAMLTVNSNPLLQLTTEEIVKLKKMISSSS